MLAWSPDADPKKLEARFPEWDKWAAGILETHSTQPLLRFFRSHEPQQHWVTALGLLADAALHTQLILGAYDGEAYWFLRRATAVFEEMTRDVPEHLLAPYFQTTTGRRAPDLATSPEPDESPPRDFFRELYDQLDEHGFDLVPYDVALEYARTVRSSFAPRMEFLIDQLLAPRGFWCPQHVTVPLLSSTHPEMLAYVPPPRS